MYKNIIHATDLNADHYQMCAKSLKIAKAFNAKLFIMHVIEPPTSLQVAQGLGFTEICNQTASAENAKEILQMISESLGIPAQQIIVSLGSIKKQIQNKISELNCELIIIGKHSSNELMELLGNNTHNLEKTINCDILTIGN